MLKQSIQFLLIISIFTLGFNHTSMAQSQKDVALDGYCPVAYKKMKKAVKGNEKYAVTHEDETYYFVNEKAAEAFKESPEKFLPEFAGYCATAMAMGKKVEAKPEIFTVYKGQTYLFSSEEAKKKFKENPDGFIEKANRNFEEMQG